MFGHLIVLVMLLHFLQNPIQIWACMRACEGCIRLCAVIQDSMSASQMYSSVIGANTSATG